VHRPRYVVIDRDGEWQIKSASRFFSASYSSKAQALSAAIELAMEDGQPGYEPAVVVRHEDGRFISEWMYGKDPKPDDAARPPRGKQAGRSGA
jgi:hypothetical protein